MNDLHDYPQRPHPGDTTPADTRNVRRRVALGVAIAVGLNIGFFTAGAAIANYLTAVFRPLFFKTNKIVYVKLDVDATPTPAPSPTPATR